MQPSTLLSTSIFLLATTSLANPTNTPTPNAVDIPTAANIEAREADPRRIGGGAGGLLGGLGRLGGKGGSGSKPNAGKPNKPDSTAKPPGSRPNVPRPRPNNNSTGGGGLGGLLGGLIPRGEDLFEKAQQENKETTERAPKKPHHKVRVWSA